MNFLWYISSNSVYKNDMRYPINSFFLWFSLIYEVKTNYVLIQHLVDCAAYVVIYSFLL